MGRLGGPRVAWPGRADRRGAAAHAQDADNPGGLPMDVFDGFRSALLADRAQFFRTFTGPFYG
jgi:hypothetical protein